MLIKLDFSKINECREIYKASVYAVSDNDYSISQKQVWARFQESDEFIDFSSYIRDSIWWVMGVKKEETRLRRLGMLIALSEAGLKIPTLRKKKYYTGE